MVLSFFAAESKHLLSFAFFSFLYDLFTNNGRNLEIAESNPIMENICSSLSVPSFSFSFTFYFPVTLSLSLALFVYAALQLLLCGVILSSIILINAEL